MGQAPAASASPMEAGLDQEAAKARIFTLDSHGLVTIDRNLEPYKEKFAKDPAQLPWLRESGDASLLNVIKQAKVTVLIGTSGQHGCFSREIVAAMQANTARPVILPLSNPTSMSEAEPKDIYQRTNGQALVATGSPFEPVVFGGRATRIGQCNNVFVFPGVGLGVLASGAKEVLPSFFTAAAKAVSQQVSEADLQNGILFPAIDKLNEVSLQVAFAVGEVAIREGVGRLCVFSNFQHNNDSDRLRELISKMRWKPVYLPLMPM